MTDYIDIRRGMEFIEVRAVKGRRTVQVVSTGMYACLVRILDGRGAKGRDRERQVWNKHLSDPTRWRRLSEETTP